jgi:hypothetical protein
VRKKKKETEEYLGANIQLYETSLSFYKDMVYYAYELETKRQDSILSQSNNMLVLVSLLSAAFGAILPSIISLFDDQAEHLAILLICSICIGVLLLVDLILIVLPQWRYSYKTTPNLLDLKRTLKSTAQDKTKEDLSNDYAEYFVSKMWKSLKSVNDLRYLYVKISMIIMLITLFTFLASVMLLLCWR